MIGVGCWLLVLGLVDLFRISADLTPLRRRVALAAGSAVAVVLVALLAVPHGAGLVAWVIAALGAPAWVLVGDAALRQVSTGRLLAAYGALLLPLVALFLAGDLAGTATGVAAVLQHSPLAEVPADRVLAIAGALLIQVSTANLVVRMLLDRVGVPAHDNEKKLRGGRVLGPMERVLIVGLGSAASLTGAGLIVGAKALLRFPELRNRHTADSYGGASDVTEYFLVGSLASWLIALATVALVSV